LAVPESEQLINAAFQKGEHAGLQTSQLLNLLREYGAQELRKAIQEALDRNTPRASSVAFILRRGARLHPGPTPIQLLHRPDLADLDIEPQNPETYDDLAKPDNDE
jgi:hypothetical protein